MVIATHSSPVPLADFLLSRGHSPSIRGHRRHLRAPLHEAARRADESGPPCVELLLRNGAPVNAVKSGDWTPLMLSALAGVAGSVKHLVEAGARVELENKDGATAAHLSAKSGCAEALGLILDACDDAVKWRTRNGRTPLHYAARAGSVECVTLLLGRGAEVGATENSGMCAGHEAAAEGEADVLKVLMATPGGDEAAWKGDVGGLTVLHHAAVSGGEEVGEVAVRMAGENNVEKQDGRGQTAMFLAVWHGRDGFVDLLRRKGGRVKGEWVPRFRKVGRVESAELVERVLEKGS